MPKIDFSLPILALAGPTISQRGIFPTENPSKIIKYCVDNFSTALISHNKRSCLKTCSLPSAEMSRFELKIRHTLTLIY